LAKQQVIFVEQYETGHVVVMNNLIDFLKKLGVINHRQWYNTHELKWGLLGKPDFIDRTKLIL